MDILNLARQLNEGEGGIGMVDGVDRDLFALDIELIPLAERDEEWTFALDLDDIHIDDGGLEQPAAVAGHGRVHRVIDADGQANPHGVPQDALRDVPRPLCPVNPAVRAAEHALAAESRVDG